MRTVGMVSPTDPGHPLREPVRQLCAEIEHLKRENRRLRTAIDAERLARIIEGESFGAYGSKQDAESIEYAEWLIDTLSVSGAHISFETPSVAVGGATP